jgi:hypothetical protein
VEFERSRGAVIPWIPAMVGVGIMIGLLVAILAWQPADQPVTAPPAASPASPAELPPAFDASQGVGTGPASPPPPRPSPTRAATSAPPKAPPASDDVTGRYLVESSFGDSFIAKVLVTNTSASPQSWTVRLVFGDNVSDLRAFWVDGHPQPTLRRNGQSYTFTSTVPIAARSSLQLKFDYSRTGRNNDPASCTTNGVTCRKG